MTEYARIASFSLERTLENAAPLHEAITLRARVPLTGSPFSLPPLFDQATNISAWLPGTSTHLPVVREGNSWVIRPPASTQSLLGMIIVRAERPPPSPKLFSLRWPDNAPDGATRTTITAPFSWFQARSSAWTCVEDPSSPELVCVSTQAAPEPHWLRVPMPPPGPLPWALLVPVMIFTFSLLQAQLPARAPRTVWIALVLSAIPALSLSIALAGAHWCSLLAAILWMLPSHLWLSLQAERTERGRTLGAVSLVLLPLLSLVWGDARIATATAGALALGIVITRATQPSLHLQGNH